MFTLIKGARVFAPDDMGYKDILIAFDKIVVVGEIPEINLPSGVEVIEAVGKLVLPGFIDQHVHIMGGGGEGGFSTRTHEVNVRDLVENGITTVVGVLGTDGVTRSLEGLYAKAKSLEEEGISTYMYSGSYQVPVVTLTGSIQRDLILIDKVVGAGEIAVSDHRSFQPSVEELCRITAEARVGGMLSGKAGVVHLHMGDGVQGLDMIFNIAADTPIPITQFVPTHVNRNRNLLEQAVRFTVEGGTVDLSAGYELERPSDKCVAAYMALKYLLESGVDENRITMSSDGNGSKPVFNEKGVLVSIEAGSCRVLLEDLRKAVFNCGIPLEKALKVITLNPAKLLKLDKDKGSITAGKHADLIVADQNLNIEKVFAKGKRMV